MKKTSGLKEALIISGSYTAYSIGAGCASGNEIMQFFVSWGGKWPLVILAITVVHAIITNYIMYNVGYTQQFSKSNECYTYYCGKYVGKFFDYFVYVCLAGFVLVMITGAGATIHEYYGLPEWVGTVGMGLICAIVACLGLRKIVDVLGFIGILLLVTMVGSGIYIIITADTPLFEAAKNTQQYVDAGIIQQAGVFGIKNPICAAVFYAGMVLMCDIAWVTSTGKMLSDKKSSKLTAILSSVFLYLPIAAMVFSLMLNLDDVAGAQIPMLAAIQVKLPVVARFYSIIIILGIFTTATGQLFLLGDRFAKEKSKKYYCIIFGVVAFGIIGGMFLPFGTVVNFVYSFMGIFAIALAVFMIVKFISAKKEPTSAIEKQSVQQ